MYTTNELLSHPLVSPVLQPSLGGLPPLLIMVGGAEVLRDEQVFLAHKCAKPKKYGLPPDSLTDAGRKQLEKYPPTPVQLQVWDDLCHVAPTLSFTRPAKFMYRSVAQFSAWALARAQNCSIPILYDDDISVISSSESDDTEEETPATSSEKQDTTPSTDPPNRGNTSQEVVVGRAGDPLPPFKDHMIRQRVTRHGDILPLEPETELPGCTLKPSDVGVIKEGPVRKWLAARELWDKKYARTKARVHRHLVKEMADGYLDFGDGETPPPSAIVGRRRAASTWGDWGHKKTKSMGLALWSLWGSKHDEMTVVRESKAGKEAAASSQNVEAQETVVPDRLVVPATHTHERVLSRSGSRQMVVVGQNQTGEQNADLLRGETLVEDLLRSRREKEAERREELGPDYVPETGVAGKRPMVDGIAVPFSLNKDATTSSMVTLHSDDEAPATAVKELGESHAMPPETEKVDTARDNVTGRNHRDPIANE